MISNRPYNSNKDIQKQHLKHLGDVIYLINMYIRLKIQIYLLRKIYEKGWFYVAFSDILKNSMTLPWKIIIAQCKALFIFHLFHCMCIAVSYSTRISISVPTTALRHCNKVNCRCSVLHWAVVDTNQLSVMQQHIAVEYEWSLRISL